MNDDVASRAILGSQNAMPRHIELGAATLLVVAASLVILTMGSRVGAQDAPAHDGGAAAAAGDSGPTEALDAGALEEVPAVPNGSRTLAAPAEGQPALVQMGVVPVIIHSIDLKAGTATVTYYVWTRWRGDVDATTRIEIVNGSLESRENDEHYMTEGVHHAYARCRATARIEVDFRAYPFDRHELRLAFEHLTLDETLLRFVVDEPSLRHVQSPELSGWIVERPRYDVVRHAYRTNWGAPYVSLDDQSAYSRFRMRMTLRHEPVPAFAKTFLPLLISIFITALAFWIEPIDTGARVSLGVAGTFGAVTSQVLVASSLPEIGYMTLSDKAHVVGLAFIFFVLMESVIVAMLARKGQIERALRIDRVSMMASYAAFLGIFVALLMTA